MNHRPTRLMVFTLLVFSIVALACNMLTDAGSTPPPVVPTVFTGGQNPRPTAIPTATKVGGNDPQPTDSGSITFGPEDIPILPDATDILASSSAVIYTTQHTKDDASQFYMTEMEKLGWVFDPSSSINGEVANIMHFTSGSKTASIIIGTATGQVKVQITISGG